VKATVLGQWFIDLLHSLPFYIVVLYPIVEEMLYRDDEMKLLHGISLLLNPAFVASSHQIKSDPLTCLLDLFLPLTRPLLYKSIQDLCIGRCCKSQHPPRQLPCVSMYNDRKFYP